MPTNITTTNQGYEKPYPSNLLAEDVLRLQNALDAIDTDMAARLTQAAAQALIDTAVSDLLAGAPQALDTLNELAAALGDDAAFSTTVTTALAARLQLAGGTMTGDLTLAGDPTSALHAATKQYTDTAVGSAAQTTGTTFTGDVSMQEALNLERVIEKATVRNVGAGGTVQFDFKTTAVIHDYADASSDFTINLRGDANTTFDSMVTNGDVVTIAYIYKTPSNLGYYNQGKLQIDGTTANQTIRWVGEPTASVATNAFIVMTYTVIKTASGTFNVLGQTTEFEP